VVIAISLFGYFAKSSFLVCKIAKSTLPNSQVKVARAIFPSRHNGILFFGFLAELATSIHPVD
jgi:hypothetical protein